MFRILARTVTPQVLSTVSKHVTKFGMDFVQGAAEDELAARLNTKAMTGAPNLGGAMASILREQYKNGNLARKAIPAPTIKTEQPAVNNHQPMKLPPRPQYHPPAASMKYIPAFIPEGTRINIPTHRNDSED